MIRDLLVPLTGSPGDEKAVAAAIRMASTLDAHLSIVQTVNMPLPAIEPWGMMPDIAGMYAALHDEAKVALERFRPMVEREDISHELRLAEPLFLEAPDTVALHARYADLSVIVAPVGDVRGDAAIVRRFFSALLFQSGRPVMVVPPIHTFEWPLERVMVAWKPTRECTDALHEAIPLLGNAATIDVVSIEPEIGDSGYGDWPGADIATHLARHGLAVNVLTLPRQDRTVATALLTHAAESRAQLLIAGGYGHSRLREWMLGGATSELLDATHLPILFSH
jgi:nucleotide-binding universal stress UspA family protein